MDIKLLDITTSDEKVFAQWLKACYEHATISAHPSTHNAAFIISGDEVVVRGVNNLPQGVLFKPERIEGPNKHIFLNHAERDAIYRAAKLGICTEGLTMVMPWLPCILCANAIISSGIKRLIVHGLMIKRTKDRWKEELTQAVKICKEAGVEITAYKDPVGAMAYMHGVRWEA